MGPKAEDKSPAKKKRQREQHNEDAKKAKIEEEGAQSAWSAAIKSKTDKTDGEVKEDSADKTNVEQGHLCDSFGFVEQVANESVDGDQSESDEDVENDEAEEEDDKE